MNTPIENFGAIESVRFILKYQETPRGKFCPASKIHAVIVSPWTLFQPLSLNKPVMDSGVTVSADKLAELFTEKWHLNSDKEVSEHRTIRVHEIIRLKTQSASDELEDEDVFFIICDRMCSIYSEAEKNREKMPALVEAKFPDKATVTEKARIEPHKTETRPHPQYKQFGARSGRY